MRTITQTKAVTCLFAAAVLWVGLSGSPCLADLYSGTLYGTSSGTGDLMTTDGWMSTSTSIQWKVYRTEVGGVEVGPWHYDYTFYSPATKGNISHLILQVSYDGALGSFDVLDPMDYQGDPDVVAAKWYDQNNNENPGWPAGVSLFALKFNQTNTGTGDSSIAGWELTFDSWRDPVWGSFYAKDGKKSGVWATAWNSGLEGGTAFIAVPDGSYVPVPAAVILGLLGLTAAGLKLRKFV